MKKLILFFLLAFPSVIFAQGVAVQPSPATKTVNGVLTPLANPTITICAAGAIGTPCSPVLVGVVFSDVALTQPKTNPFTGDANGNYPFAIAAGTYTVSVTGTNVSGTSYQFTAGSSGISFVSALPALCTPGITASVQLSVAPYTLNYCSATNTWTPLGASTGSATGTAGQVPYFSALNTMTGGTVVLDMAGIAGADLGAKMANCAAALPSGTGICRGDDLPTVQTLSSAVVTSNQVTYTFCGQHVSQTAAVALTANFSGILGCHNSTAIFTKAANIDQITLNGVNNFVEGIQLQGVGGSFTGNGIVVSNTATQADVAFNYVQSEAGNQIKVLAGTAVIFDNVALSSSTTSAAISANGGTLISNFVQTSAFHGIEANGNTVLVESNTINLNVVSAVSGLCAVIADGDQIGDRIINNIINITDTHGGDVSGGDCDSPTGTHNLNMLFHGDHTNGFLSGGAQAYGAILNNAANLNTNWIVTFEGIGCVHLTACIKRTDTQNNVTEWKDIQPGDVGLDAGTGSTRDIFIEENTPITFANLPTPSGIGSRIFCVNCAVGKVVVSGGTGNVVTKLSSTVWQGLPNPAWGFVQGTSQHVNAGSTTLAFTTNNIPGDFIIVGVACAQGASPTITVTDTAGNAYSSAIAIQGNGTPNWWGQVFYSPAVKGGANTVNVASSVNVCTQLETFPSEYSGIALISPEDGAGASTSGNSTSLASGNFTVTPNDLEIGFAVAPAQGLCVGAGSGFLIRGGCPTGNAILEDTTPTSTPVSATASANTGAWAMIGLAFKRQP